MRFFADLVEAVPDWPAHRDECSRRAVASARQRCVSAFFGRHLSRRARTGDGGHLHLLRVLESLPEHPQPDGVTSVRHDPLPPRPRGASAASQDRAAGVVNAGSRGAPANVTPPDAVQKTAMASCRASPPLPTLGFPGTDPLAVECHAEKMQCDRSTWRRRLIIICNEIHEEP